MQVKRKYEVYLEMQCMHKRKEWPNEDGSVTATDVVSVYRIECVGTTYRIMSYCPLASLTIRA